MNEIGKTGETGITQIGKSLNDNLKTGNLNPIEVDKENFLTKNINDIAGSILQKNTVGGDFGEGIKSLSTIITALSPKGNGSIGLDPTALISISNFTILKRS
ncbi:MAG TPA: hypothetical protein VLL98_04730 [Rickettsiales bacterium]|nr:hypothetical protein [Rickettsiales bacterium]